MNTIPGAKKFPWKFFLILLMVCIPFWLAGAVVDQFLPLPDSIHLPFAALLFVAPSTVALILRYRENGSAAVQQLLKQSFDFSRIKNKAWILPALFFWPIMAVLEYALIKVTGRLTPGLSFPDWALLSSFVLFFFGAIGEELGWLGYALDPLQERWGALGASLILGAVRSVFHVIGFIQAHNAPMWIVWQCLSLFFGHIIFVWLYNNTGKSIFAVIVLHATYNVATLVLPNFGLIYDPFYAFILTIPAAVIVIFFWGPDFTRFHYPRLIPNDGMGKKRFG